MGGQNREQREIKLDMCRSIGVCRALLLRDEPLTAEDREVLVGVFNVLEEMIDTSEVWEKERAQ